MYDATKIACRRKHIYRFIIKEEILHIDVQLKKLQKEQDDKLRERYGMRLMSVAELKAIKKKKKYDQIECLQERQLRLKAHTS